MERVESATQDQWSATSDNGSHDEGDQLDGEVDHHGDDATKQRDNEAHDHLQWTHGAGVRVEQAAEIQPSGKGIVHGGGLVVLRWSGINRNCAQQGPLETTPAMAEGEMAVVM